MQELSFTIYAIIEFEDDCDEDIKDWVRTKLTDSQLNNGSQLYAEFTKNFEDKVIWVHFKLISIESKTSINLK